jgi:glutamate carboxypeptidase
MALALPAMNSTAADLSPTHSATAPRGQFERRIWQTAEAAYPAQVELLEKLVNIDTGSGNREGWRAAADLLVPRLEALGMAVEYVPAEAPGYPDNIVATMQGSGHSRILVIAHLDTVFEAGFARAHPFRIEGPLAKGPGISDEKAGLVGALYALQILRDLKATRFKSVTLLIDSSEERGSAGSKALIVKLAGQNDFTLNMEPGLEPDGVVVSRKGSGTFHIHVKGRAAHAGVAPQDGRNAAVELLHQLEGVDQFPAAGDGLTVNLTVLSAGARTNVIPESATASLNVRARTKRDFEKTEAALRERADHPKVPDTHVTVTSEPSFPPLQENRDSDSLAQDAQRIYAELGLKLATGSSGGGSESALVYEMTPVLDGLGPVGGGFHSEAEFLDLTTVTPRLYLLTRLLTELGTRRPATRSH